VLEDKTIF